MSNKETHPSYGMLQFSRTTGDQKNLFGSSIQHHDTIKMCLKEGSVERDLNTDFYMDGKQIVEVEMSYSQFAEAITSMNVGAGVPVTIRWLRDVGEIEPCPFTDKKQQFENEFKQRLSDINNDTNNLIIELQKLFESKTSLTKADKTTIMNKLTKISQNMNQNNAFTYTCFNEQMDKTVTEAKGEIEAFMQNKLNSIARSVLVENREQLLETTNPVNID